MSERRPDELTNDWTSSVPGDAYVAATSPTVGMGKLKADSLGGGGSSGPPLADAAPLPPTTTANVGTSTDAAREDHQHRFQTGTETPFTPVSNIQSTNVQAAIEEVNSERIANNQKGVANGVASLDASTTVPVAQIPTLPASKTLVAATGTLPQTDLQTTLATMDSRIEALTQSLTLAGTYNAATNTVSAIAGQGLTDGALPAAGPTNANLYLIVNTGGTGIGNAAGLGTIEAGNWIYSTGSAWVELVVSTGSVAATAVVNTPAGTISATNVQAALNELDTEKVPTTRQVAGGLSITGGGALNVDATLQLVGDQATPGANKVYGTDASGNKTWKNDPAGGGGTVAKPKFHFRSSSLPVSASAAARTYVAGVAGNGVQYPMYELSGSADNVFDLFGHVPPDYANGDLTIRIPFCSPVSSGQVTLGVAFCALTAGFAVNDAFTFTYVSGTVSTPSTAYRTGVVTFTMTRAQANSISAGDPIVMRVKRTGTDTSTGVVYVDWWGISVAEA